MKVVRLFKKNSLHIASVRASVKSEGSFQTTSRRNCLLSLLEDILPNVVSLLFLQSGHKMCKVGSSLGKSE